MDTLFGEVFAKQARNVLKSHARYIDKKYRDHREEWTLSNDTPAAEQMFAEQLVFAPLKRAGITSDAEVLDAWEDRVLDMSELENVEARDVRREKRSEGDRKCHCARLSRAETRAVLFAADDDRYC